LRFRWDDRETALITWKPRKLCAAPSFMTQVAGPTLPRLETADSGGFRAAMRLTLTLSPFVSEGLTREAKRQQITVEELINYAAVYYLADLDSGRLVVDRPPLEEDAEDASASGT
jgi:hypothetical protein